VTAKKKPDLKTLLKNSTLPERVVSYVTDRQLASTFQRLLDDLEEAGRKRASDKRMSAEVKRIATEIESVRGQMQESTIEFTLRGMRSADWREIKARHPMSDDPSPLDQYLEADANGLFDQAVRLSMVDETMPAGPDWKPLEPEYVPVLDDEDWANLTGKCTDGDWERFTDAVFAMNEKGSAVPFSRSASAVLRPTDDD
jgi:hypothetical protein